MKKLLVKIFECEDVPREKVVEGVCLTIIAIPFLIAMFSVALIFG